MDWVDIILAIIVSSAVTLVVGAVDALLNPKTHDWKLAEYALIFILVTVAIFVIVTLRSNIGEPFSTINKSLTGV